MSNVTDKQVATPSESEHVVDRLISERIERPPVLFKRLGIRVSNYTGIRWILYGADGVRLEAIKVGGQWRTSEEAVRRFLRARADAQTARRERRGHPADREVARRRLDARGIAGAKA